MRIELRRQKHRFFSESKSFHFSAKMILYISNSHWLKIFALALIITKYFKKYFLRMGIGGICTFLSSPTVPLLVITISTPAVNVLWGYFFCAQCLIRKKTLAFPYANCLILLFITYFRIIFHCKRHSDPLIRIPNSKKSIGLG